ncbi:MAG: right-handed parallel beta-helix repeat-containing protein [Verrucomicrobiales bacterium]
MKPNHWLPAALLALAIAPHSHPAEIAVSSLSELVAAAGKAKPGDAVVLAAGDYETGGFLGGVRGDKAAPITIRSADPENPAVFRGGKQALHLSGCRYVTLSDLRIVGCAINGLNIDDAGEKGSPAAGIVLQRLHISDIGPRGNHDGIKLSGVDRFAVRGCTIEGWGGSGIDMVGCHDGVIEACRFAGKAGFSQSNAVQMKGGSARIAVLANRFENAGQRAINLGGSTGLEYFRPKVGAFEASEIEVAGNLFIGSLAPVAWVNADGGHVHHNTIVDPEKWVVRILQENQGDGFKPCQGGVFEDNLIVFDRRVNVFANVGGGTAPETFRFRGNAWFERGAARQRKPALPGAEAGGVYGVDPQLDAAGAAKSGDARLMGKGAGGYQRDSNE